MSKEKTIASLLGFGGFVSSMTNGEPYVNNEKYEDDKEETNDDDETKEQDE